MKRLLTVILTGAALVAAQPASDSTTIKGKNVMPKDISQITEQFRHHLDSALAKADFDVSKARQAAEEFQNQMKGKTPEEIKTAMEAKRQAANIELAHAIARLDSASADVKAQVEDVAAKIQARLQEKSAQLKAIQARIEAHRATIDAHVTDMKAKNPEETTPVTPKTQN
jgi:maltodextrin utilization protein YvdJ